MKSPSQSKERWMPPGHQRELYEQQEIFRIFTARISDRVKILNRDGTDADSGSKQESENTDEPPGKNSLLDAIHPEDRDAIRVLFQQVIHAKMGRSLSYREIGKNGSIHEMEGSVDVVCGVNGEVEKLLLVTRNVTARQYGLQRLERQNRALAALAHSRELMDQEMIHTFHAISEAAANTLSVRRASIWFFTENLGAIRCVDLFESDILAHGDGAELRAAVHPKYFAALAEGRTIAAHDARLDPRTAEFARDYLFPLGISSMLDAPIRRDGRLVGVICIEHIGEAREWTPDEELFAGSLADLLAISLEVRERRNAEASLREAHDTLEEKVIARTRDLAEANERLRELDRMKSEFLAMMSHELRTPLNSIIGFTSILRQGMAGPVNEEQKKQLGMIHGSAKHLLALINDLLDLSRIESGRMELQIEQLSIEGVCMDVVESIAPMAEAKQIRVVTEMLPGIPEIYTDRKKLYQVLLNLVNNAVKFSERGEIHIHGSCMGGTVTISVSDQGIGIRPEQMKNLFQAFRQLDGSSRRIYEGTGLGLHLSRKLLDLLGGEIHAESEFGKGSVFTFTIPSTPLPAS